MSASSTNLRIAIAASGLSHIFRGVESWADDLGKALRQHGVDAVTFQGSGPAGPGVVTLHCWKRTDSRTAWVHRVLRRIGAWRLHLGSLYDIEQTTFALSLWLRTRRCFDIIHVQDPVVALWLDRLHRWRLSRPRVVLAHGTDEDSELLKQYSNLQLLAPPYVAEWEACRPPSQAVFAIPNPVDVSRFVPPEDLAAKRAAREACGLPKNTLLILSVAALRITHKRLDYLMQEFDSFRRTYAGSSTLVIAGGLDAETSKVLQVAEDLHEADIRILQNVPRAHVATLLQAADIFTLASLHEMLGTALLEALAAGLPIACNRTPVFEYAIGSAGYPTDIRQDGALAAQFSLLSDPSTRTRLGKVARHRAETVFSTDAVVKKTLAMYSEIMQRS